MSQNKALSVQQNPVPNTDLIPALKNSFYPGADDSSVMMVLEYCRAAGLDPMTKPVHIVPMWDKTIKAKRPVIMPGIGMYRIIADRSGKYAGQDDSEFGPDCQEWNMTYPQWCKVTVYKVTPVGRVPYSAKVFWKESYALADNQSDLPNAMWRKRPYGQLEKCAEAAALRKAFPEIGAQPTAEEMEGKTIDGMLVDPPSYSATPQPGRTRADEIMGKLVRSKTAPPVEAPAPGPGPIEAATVEMDEVGRELLRKTLREAPTGAEVDALLFDLQGMGCFSPAELDQFATLGSARIVELEFQHRIETTITQSALESLSKEIVSSKLPDEMKDSLLATARKRYKLL